jgi:muramoyltetrapeptide carboxypeptidase
MGVILEDIMTVTRRDLIIALSSFMAAPALSPAFAAPPGIRKPPRLRPGDTIGLIEPATASDEAFDIILVEEAITAMGLKSKRGAHVLNRFGYLAGTDKDRAADINMMFADKDVRAIFAVRGGWGCARTLPFLDWNIIRANPKLLLGYSDITALHMAIAAKGGFVTLHGPNASSAWGKTSVDSLRSVAFDGATPLYINPVTTEDRLVQRRWRTQVLHDGKAQGRLLGGNLTVLTALAGTPYLPDFNGAILFLEDVGEAEYRIDRMLTQLDQAGVLKNLTGVVFGQCTDCIAKDGAGYSGFTLTDVLQQHLGSLGIPAFHGAFFGHIADQYIIPVGARAEIDAGAGTIRMLEAAVS